MEGLGGGEYTTVYLACDLFCSVAGRGGLASGIKSQHVLLTAQAGGGLFRCWFLYPAGIIAGYPPAPVRGQRRQ